MTREGFDLLLAQLDAEREKAGEKYEVPRRKLIRLFGWWGSDDADELADEAFDRVAKRLAAGEAVRDVSGYLMGVARLVFKEHVRRQIRMRATVQQFPREASTADDRVGDEARRDCYEHCLGELPPQSRDFVVPYYQMHDRNQAHERSTNADSG